MAKPTKGPRPDPLPPFDEDDHDESVLKSPLGGSLQPTNYQALVPALRKIETILEGAVDEAKEYADRAIESQEAIASEAMWARRTRLVALASDNGKATLEESKNRLERMLTLLGDLETLEEKHFPVDDDDDDEGGEPILSNRIKEK